MPFAAFATLLAATLSGPALPSQSPTPAPPAHVRAPKHVARPAPTISLPVGDIYAARAKRRIASYLRMRLLELRKERLDSAVEALEGRLGVDDLIRSR